jgi:hypothetical protein
VVLIQEIIKDLKYNRIIIIIWVSRVVVAVVDLEETEENFKVQY